MNDHGYYKRGIKLNYNSTFTRIPPNGKLHRMVLNGLNILPFVEPLLNLLINDAIVPFK